MTSAMSSTDPPTRPHRYAQLTWPQVAERVAEDPVCVIPVATLEDHGYHLPIDTDVVIAALERNKKFLRGEIAHRVNLKFAPDLRFRVDERFDEAERIEKLLRTPAVQRDLKRDEGES